MMKKQKLRAELHFSFLAALLVFTSILMISIAWDGRLTAILTTTEAPSGTVTLITLFTDDEVRTRLDSELGLFSERFPQVTVDHRTVPYRELHQRIRAGEVSGDVVTIVNPVAYDASTFGGEPLPWSGDLWRLYYRRSVLQDALGEIPDAPQTLDELVTLFEQVNEAAPGLRPLGLGASHGWPLTALVQHVAGARSEPGGSMATTIAAGQADPDGPEVREVIELLREWRERDWISAQAHRQPWTTGVMEVMEGAAAFTLLNQQFFTPVPVGLRNEFGSFPFPGNWAVGSVIYVARPAGSENQVAADELERYLTSAGTVDRLERSLGIPFFGGVQDPALPTLLVPSVTSMANDPYHRSLWQAAVRGIW